jgi:hypothetical protein
LKKPINSNSIPLQLKFLILFSVLIRKSSTFNLEFLTAAISFSNLRKFSLKDFFEKKRIFAAEVSARETKDV